MISTSSRRTAFRVLHCPENVGGHPAQLADAERDIGLDSRCIALRPHRFAYQADEVVWPHPRGRIRERLDRARLLRRALNDFDVVHFNFGQTLFLPRPLPSERRRTGLFAALDTALEFKDAWALRRAGKTLAVTFQGDDARQGDRCRELFEINVAAHVDAAYYTPETDAEKRRRIALFANVVHCVFALNPDLLNMLPRGSRFMPYAAPDLDAWRPARSERTEGPPLIVHAPTHRAAKGTCFVVDAVERLKAEGIPVELSMVENMSRDEARRRYEQADILVDQLLAGWYGGVSMELMALGKPVVCYIRTEDLRFIPSEMRGMLPVVTATPASLFEVLRTLLAQGPEHWRRIGLAGRAYVERWHAPVQVARMHAAAYSEARESAQPQ